MIAARGVSLMLLEVGLLLGTVAALLYVVRMIVGTVTGLEWFWGGAIASLSAPPAFAAAIRLLAAPRSVGKTDHA